MKEKQPITRKGTRILRPEEYEKLRDELKRYQRIQLDALLLTGMRYVEAKRLQKNPDWFDGEFINIPEEGSRKKEMKFRERTIRLSYLGQRVIEDFLNTKPLPHNNGFNQNLKRWSEKAGIGTEGMTAKVTRKTWVSWLVTSFPEYREEVYLSLGHSRITAMKHYLGLPFTDRDKEGMKKWVNGWK